MNQTYLRFLFETEEHILLPGKFNLLRIETIENLKIITCLYSQLESIEDIILRLACRKK